MQQALHQRRHQIGMISQRINTLRHAFASESLMAPADGRGPGQRFLPLRLSGIPPPGSDNHHRIVSLPESRSALSTRLIWSSTLPAARLYFRANAC